ncbi:MAG: hypothetical protein EZS28_045847 [Streblomastix strix]|uniref:Uncharacterized protein n=1 Tax=Streblomastix strix TaxID=222440 RepID=A0A5J4TJI6_9EUKA|nr:MAG: hypothetical protein EZS28_045847 [Streblomastix strix]
MEDIRQLPDAERRGILADWRLSDTCLKVRTPEYPEKLALLRAYAINKHSRSIDHRDQLPKPNEVLMQTLPGGSIPLNIPQFFIKQQKSFSKHAQKAQLIFQIRSYQERDLTGIVGVSSANKFNPIKVQTRESWIRNAERHRWQHEGYLPTSEPGQQHPLEVSAVYHETQKPYHWQRTHSLTKFRAKQISKGHQKMQLMRTQSSLQQELDQELSEKLAHKLGPGENQFC